MIVVNSVMEGFTGEMQNRIHGILGDLVVESRDMMGMPDFDRQAENLRNIAGSDIAAMSPVVAVPAVLYFDSNGDRFTRQIDLIGIDEATQSGVSDFGKYLQNPENRKQMSFDLRNGGYDVRDHQGDGTTPERRQMRDAGWQHRREMTQSGRVSRRLGSSASAAFGNSNRPIRLPGIRKSRTSSILLRSRTPAPCSGSP